MRVYFAHPMTEYGTKLEARAIRAIEKRFKYSAERNSETLEVVNPSSDKICGAATALYPIAGMGLFDLLAQGCDATVAMPFPDGSYGAGVFSEISAAFRRGRPLCKIDPETLEISPLSFYEAHGLSVSETRARIGGRFKEFLASRGIGK